MALTDEQITACWERACHGYGLGKYEKFARAIESAACAERDARIAELERQLHEQAVSLAEAHKDAERLDYIQKNARNDPKMDGNHVWWPTTLNSALKGPTLRQALDNAMQKGWT